MTWIWYLTLLLTSNYKNNLQNGFLVYNLVEKVVLLEFLLIAVNGLIFYWQWFLKLLEDILLISAGYSI